MALADAGGAAGQAAAAPSTSAVAWDTSTEPPAADRALVPAALAAVLAAGGVDLVDGGGCAADQLVVSFDDPGSGWRSGGHISPLGPAPSEMTTQVNGVVLCTGSHHAYVGFDAVRTGQAWDVELVPDPSGGEDGEEPGTNLPDTAARPAAVPNPVTSWRGRARGRAIEGYPRYEGQRICSPSAKPGTVALRDLLLSRYPTTSSLGISRGCDVGGRSEHKEGRAFDWGAQLGNATQRKAAEDFLARLQATDSFGNRHALARRMGVLYVIWNRQIWSTSRADAGWRAYSGSSPHTDHLHMSLSWAGAEGRTSFWSGKVVAGMSATPRGAGSSGGGDYRSAPATARPERSAPTRSTTQKRSQPARPASTAPSPSASPSPRPADQPSPAPWWPVPVPTGQATPDGLWPS
jgi:hypothetical protein